MKMMTTPMMKTISMYGFFYLKSKFVCLLVLIRFYYCLQMLDESKGGMYTGEEGDMSGQPEDTGEIFPHDPNVNFNLGDSILPGDIGDADGTGMENQSDEEDSEEDSDNDDGECNEFTYQSDASYSQGI